MKSGKFAHDVGASVELFRSFYQKDVRTARVDASITIRQAGMCRVSERAVDDQIR